MFTKTKRVILFVSLLATLAGCAQTSPSFDDMSRTYQTVIEKYDRNGLFLNVIRSSKQLPLSFLTIPSITGSGSIAQSAGIDATVVSTIPGTAGGFLSAGAGTFYSPSLGISLSRGFTFTQSSLDNAAFQKSFMSQIPLVAVNALRQANDDNRELIYSLVLDSIVIVSPDGKTSRLKNHPQEPQFPEFQHKLNELVSLGLSTELLDSREAIGPTMSASQVNDIIFKYLDVKDDKRLSLEDVTQKGEKQKTYQMYQNMKTARFCFVNGQHAEAVKQKYGDDLFCQDTLDTVSTLPPLQEQNVSANKNQYELGFNIRSTLAVFNYLGNVVKVQTQAKEPRLVMLKSASGPSGKDALKTFSEEPLLVVQKNRSGLGKIYAEIDYEGDTYTIPAENAGHSSQVMSLLYGFVGLNKVPGAIPQSPAVLIK
jgi:hypothetical protein